MAKAKVEVWLLSEERVKMSGSLVGAQGGSEGVVVYEGQQDGIWPPIRQFQQQKLCLWRDVA